MTTTELARKMADWCEESGVVPITISANANGSYVHLSPDDFGRLAMS